MARNRTNQYSKRSSGTDCKLPQYNIHCNFPTIKHLRWCKMPLNMGCNQLVWTTSIILAAVVFTKSVVWRYTNVFAFSVTERVLNLLIKNKSEFISLKKSKLELWYENDLGMPSLPQNFWLKKILPKSKNQLHN